jgi:hypothetical protein
MRPMLTMLMLLLGACNVLHAPGTTTEPWERESVVRRIVEPAADPADMVCADARWFVRIDNLAGWLEERHADPLIDHLWSIASAHQPPQLLKRAAEGLGLSERDAVAAYFGGATAVIGQKVDDARGVVMMTQADESALAALPEALGLSPLGVYHRIGPFDFYTSREGEQEYTFAFGRRWLMIARASSTNHMRRLISAVAAGEKPLSGHAPFKMLLADLPAAPSATVLVREPGESGKSDDHHALTLTRDGSMIVADYLAQSPRLDDYLKDVQEVPGLDFGSAPDSTIFALTLSAMHRTPPGAGLANMLLFPRNFRDHVRPGIAPPLLAFLASLPPEEVEPDPGVVVPVMGIAVRLTDPAVARDLDRIVRGIHFLLSASRLDLASGFFGVRRVNRDGLEYHVADFGTAIQRRIDDPSVRRLAALPSSAGLTKISFGCVGDYYLVCTQEAFFDRWRQAQEDATRRLVGSDHFQEFDLREPPRLLASFVTSAPRLAALLHEVADYWRRARESGEAPPESRPAAPPRQALTSKPGPDRIEQPLRWIADGLQYRHSFSLQLWRDESERVRGQLRIAPPIGSR